MCVELANLFMDISALRLKKNDKGNERKYTKGCSLFPALVMQCILKNVYEVCFH
jgi:hypothetical protein